MNDYYHIDQNFFDVFRSICCKKDLYGLYETVTFTIAGKRNLLEFLFIYTTLVVLNDHQDNLILFYRIIYSTIDGPILISLI